VLTGTGEHQSLASGFEIGARFHAAPVVRIADARRMHLGHTFRADGRWRLVAFGDRDGTELRTLTEWLGTASDSPVRRFTPARADIDAVIDVHGVFQAGHRDVDVTALSEILLPRTGSFGLQDWEKAWAVDPRDDIFTARGVSASGAIVLVRPDQYVAHVLPLTAHDELIAFFAGILLPQR